jgi:hypothetical protein
MKDLRKYMNLIESFDEDDWEDEDEEELDLPSVTVGESLRPELIKTAQEEYEEWDESNIDHYAGGGICHFIADNFCEVLDRKGITCSTVSSDNEQHVYVVAQFAEGVYSIDLHYSYYETGGGFRWSKIPNVVLDPSDIYFYRLSHDPKEFKQYVGWED